MAKRPAAVCLTGQRDGPSPSGMELTRIGSRSSPPRHEIPSLARGLEDFHNMEDQRDAGYH